MKIRTFLEHKYLAAWLLRIALAIVFGYAATSSFFNPDEWVGFLPPFLTNLVDAKLLLHVFSVYELGLVVWLLSGVYMRYAALLCAATLAGIVVSNLNLFAISFRDMGLALAALALAVLDTQQGEAK